MSEHLSSTSHRPCLARVRILQGQPLKKEGKSLRRNLFGIPCEFRLAFMDFGEWHLDCGRAARSSSQSLGAGGTGENVVIRTAADGASCRSNPNHYMNESLCPFLSEKHRKHLTKLPKDPKVHHEAMHTLWPPAFYSNVISDLSRLSTASELRRTRFRSRTSMMHCSCTTYLQSTTIAKVSRNDRRQSSSHLTIPSWRHWPKAQVSWGDWIQHQCCVLAHVGTGYLA